MGEIIGSILDVVFKVANFISSCFREETPIATGAGITLIVAIPILIAVVAQRPKSKTK